MLLIFFINLLSEISGNVDNSPNNKEIRGFYICFDSFDLLYQEWTSLLLECLQLIFMAVKTWITIYVNPVDVHCIAPLRIHLIPLVFECSLSFSSKWFVWFEHQLNYRTTVASIYTLVINSTFHLTMLTR